MEGGTKEAQGIWASGLWFVGKHKASLSCKMTRYARDTCKIEPLGGERSG